MLADVTETDASMVASLPRVEHVAHHCEIMSSLRRAAQAAERFADLSAAMTLRLVKEKLEGPMAPRVRQHQLTDAEVKRLRVAARNLIRAYWVG